MPQRNGQPKLGEIRDEINKLIPNHIISPNNPYLICIRNNPTSMDSRSIRLIVYRTSGFGCPKTLSKQNIVWSMLAFYGKTPKSNLMVRLSMAIGARDFFNMLHRIEHKKQHVTIEMLKSITSPHLKIKIIEACCKAAI